MTDPKTPEATPAATAGVAAPASGRKSKGRKGLRPPSWIAMVFLLPALLLLGCLVLYPIGYSIYRSFFGVGASDFAGIDNYTVLFEDKDNRKAMLNTAIWVVVAPTVVTALGLVYAVLTERVRWATAFKMVVFMPMAISFLASGIVFRMVYEQDPDKGIANAAAVVVHDTFSDSASYPGAGPRTSKGSPVKDENGAVVTQQPVQAGQTALLPLLKVKPEDVPSDAKPAATPVAKPGAVSGTVWFDFTRGGGGTLNAPDKSEVGLPGIKVEALDGQGKVAGSATSAKDGTFTIKGVDQGSYTLRIDKSNFAAKYGGVEWLGSTLITPSIIGAYVWIWAGFAMVLIAAGLAAIPRDALEAARVDGATEWQVFRRVTMPLLSPVLVVVFVTLVINVLKVFDLVLIIGGSDRNASVLAFEMWAQSRENEGAASAIAVALFLLVLPAMLFNIRRFRREQK